jgi:hypothetical protein
MAIANGDGRLRFSDMFRLMRESAEFRSDLSRQLSAVPFSGFRWETPPVTRASIDREFECVLIDSPDLSSTPDVTAFSDYFPCPALADVAVFPNRGLDALLVVPCPVAAHSVYVHLAAFLRNAPEPQCHSLWRAVGHTMAQRLSSAPIWLNTAGGGVAWLHVRLDSRPKYYGYLPYLSYATTQTEQVARLQSACALWRYRGGGAASIIPLRSPARGTG